MKNLITLVLIISTLLLSSCEMIWGCQTEACLKYDARMFELKQDALERTRAHDLEKLRIEAEIESNKPVEIKVQELKNEEDTLWESAVNAAAIWAWAYVWVKLIDTLFQ